MSPASLKQSKRYSRNLADTDEHAMAPSSRLDATMARTTVTLLMPLLRGALVRFMPSLPTRNKIDAILVTAGQELSWGQST